MRPVCEETRAVIAALAGSRDMADACARAATVARRPWDAEALRSRLKKHKVCCSAHPPTAYMAGAASWRAAPVAGLDYEDEADTDVRDTDPPAACRAWVDPLPEPPERQSVNLAQVLAILPDIHAGYHSERALRCAIAASRAFLNRFPRHMRRLVQLGDLMDNESLSAHVRSRKARLSFAEEVEEAKRILDMMGTLEVARRDITCGNHDEWIDRYTLSRAPEFAGIVSQAELLGFAARGWNVTPYRRELLIGRTRFSHEFGKSGPSAPLAGLSTGGGGKVAGHTHAMGVHYAGADEGLFRVSANLGWLGDFDSISYASQAVCRERWCHGFGVGYLDTSGFLWLTPVPIVDGRCIVEGVVYQA